jgi:hypothetical protein
MWKYLSSLGATPSPTPDEAAAWRLWMSLACLIVFWSFSLMLRRGSQYCSSGKQNDFREEEAILPFPSPHFAQYAQGTFARLKEEQSRLCNKPRVRASLIAGDARPPSSAPTQEPDVRFCVPDLRCLALLTSPSATDWLIGTATTPLPQRLRRCRRPCNPRQAGSGASPKRGTICRVLRQGGRADAGVVRQ